MGSVIAVFSTNKWLAGGANLLTWAIGLWTLWRAARWIFLAVKSSFSESLTALWKDFRKSWSDHLRCASNDTLYFVTYCARKGVHFFLFFTGFCTGIIGVMVDKNYASMPQILRIILIGTAEPSQFEVITLECFLVIFGVGSQLVLAQVFITSTIASARRKVRLTISEFPPRRDI